MAIQFNNSMSILKSILRPCISPLLDSPTVYRSGGTDFAHRPVSGRYSSIFGKALLAAVFLLAGCTRTVVTRLDIGFDADSYGQPPNFPLPTPPNDQLTATVRQLTTSEVVADRAGGKWLRITPSPQFLAAPDQRRLTTIATAEAFTTNPPAQIRGSLRLRLDGPGTVTIGFRVSQGGNFTDIIGGVQLYKSAFSPQGEVHVIPGFRIERIEDIYPLPTIGNRIANYQPGRVININWSIDQSSRILYVGAGGTSESTTFRAVSSNGVATTPIQVLSVWVWLEKPSSNTVVFLDRLRAEEYEHWRK
ncbi:MAG: hypothetical protein JJU28_07940 [Cyclobacteriaceae bacterium]|nr:hypothetical protein [Cyclobacteriaceae bacterium]